MALDPVSNKGSVLLSLGYDAAATSIVLQTGDGTKIPDPSADGNYNLVWYNASDYADPAQDPNFEIVRVTGPAGTGDTKTITRAQEGSAASTKNSTHSDGTTKTYRMILAFTKKMRDDMNSGLVPTVVALGDTIFGNATPAWAVLTGNITTARKFLRQTGTGAVSATPAWDTLVVGDLPTHTHAATDITSGVLALARGGLNTDISVGGLLGDVLYADAATTFARLAGQITTTRKFLRQTGTGAVSAAPAWDTLVVGDLPTHVHAAADITSGILAVLRGSTGVSTFGGANTILYTTVADALASIVTANNGLLVTGATGIPSIGTDIPTAVTIGGAAIYRVAGTDVAVTDGGTGASTALAGFNVLSPLTTKGDILTRDATNNVRLAVGANDQVLTADSAQASGLKWAAGGGGGGAFDPTTTAEIYEEFSGGGNTNRQIGELGWYLENGTIGGPTAEAGAVGIVLFQSSGIINTSFLALGSVNGQAQLLHANEGDYTLIIRCRRTAAADANFNLRLGLMRPGATDPTDGIYFRALGTGNWFAVTRAASTETPTDTTVAQTTTFKTFKIVMNAAGTSVEFFIDGVSRATHTTNIPGATGVDIRFSSQNIDGAPRTLSIDYVHFKATGMTR